MTGTKVLAPEDRPFPEPFPIMVGPSETRADVEDRTNDLLQATRGIGAQSLARAVEGAERRPEWLVNYQTLVLVCQPLGSHALNLFASEREGMGDDAPIDVKSVWAFTKQARSDYPDPTTWVESERNRLGMYAAFPGLHKREFLQQRRLLRSPGFRTLDPAERLATEAFVGFFGPYAPSGEEASSHGSWARRALVLDNLGVLLYGKTNWLKYRGTHGFKFAVDISQGLIDVQEEIAENTGIFAETLMPDPHDQRVPIRSRWAPLLSQGDMWPYQINGELRAAISAGNKTWGIIATNPMPHAQHAREERGGTLDVVPFERGIFKVDQAIPMAGHQGTIALTPPEEASDRPTGVSISWNNQDLWVNRGRDWQSKVVVQSAHMPRSAMDQTS